LGCVAVGETREFDASVARFLLKRSACGKDVEAFIGTEGRDETLRVALAEHIQTGKAAKEGGARRGGERGGTEAVKIVKETRGLRIEEGRIAGWPIEGATVENVATIVERECRGRATVCRSNDDTDVVVCGLFDGRVLCSILVVIGERADPDIKGGCCGMFSASGDLNAALSPLADE